ncbi:MAG: hypothetical protein JST00_26470 [Deltaproteobacteria bacterium]|nr:hypothetical protein [Deltaproteobacteria bacterium]
MGVEVLVVQGERGAASGIVRMLRRLRIEGVIATSADEGRAMLAAERRWRGFLVDPKVAARNGGSDANDAGLALLAEIASSKAHRFSPRAAISRVASARLVAAVTALGARYFCYPCEGGALTYFAFETHAALIDDTALRAYVTELGIAASLRAAELATLAAYLGGPHETVAERLELAESTVATHVGGILSKMASYEAVAPNMHALEAWILRRARRRS